MKHFTNNKPYSFEELEKLEIRIYNKTHFDYSEVDLPINILDICQRPLNVFEDRDYNLPQNIFLIKNYRGKTLVGRKIRSILRIENKINAINCSMITAPMLLGILHSRKKNQRNLEIAYFPFNNEEKKQVFKEIKDKRMLDIYYPYKFKDFKTNKEEVSPIEGWTFNPEKKQYLGYGEKHLREFTNNYFKNYNFSGKNIYDPACSTGEFLFEFKKNHPNSHTIGHDLSQEMIDYAKDYVDESFCCNAIDSPLKNNIIDLLFLRFLNSEVVSTAESYKIMHKLLPKVKVGGLVVCFGHTPVLITKEWFIRQGLKIINCHGYDEKRKAIFQYYVMEKIR